MDKIESLRMLPSILVSEHRHIKLACKAGLIRSYNNSNLGEYLSSAISIGWCHCTEERSLVDDRLEYLEEEGVEVVPRKAVIGEWVGKQATRYTWGQSLTRSLARADIKMKVGEFILLVAILTFIGALVGWFLGGGPSSDTDISTQSLMNIPGILIGGAVGFFAPVLYLRRQQGRRLIKLITSSQIYLSDGEWVKGTTSTMQAMEI
jgi:hypothetical protein